MFDAHDATHQASRWFIICGVAILIAPIFAACSSGNPIQPSDAVKDVDAAIEIGMKACSIPPDQGHPSEWYARLEGDDWLVWWGSDGRGTPDWSDLWAGTDDHICSAASVSVSKRDGKADGCVVCTR